MRRGIIGLVLVTACALCVSVGCKGDSDSGSKDDEGVSKAVLEAQLKTLHAACLSDSAETAAPLIEYRGKVLDPSDERQKMRAQVMCRQIKRLDPEGGGFTVGEQGSQDGYETIKVTFGETTKLFAFKEVDGVYALGDID